MIFDFDVDLMPHITVNMTAISMALREDVSLKTIWFGELMPTSFHKYPSPWVYEY